MTRRRRLARPCSPSCWASGMCVRWPCVPCPPSSGLWTNRARKAASRWPSISAAWGTSSMWTWRGPALRCCAITRWPSSCRKGWPAAVCRRWRPATPKACCGRSPSTCPNCAGISTTSSRPAPPAPRPSLPSGRAMPSVSAHWNATPPPAWPRKRGTSPPFWWMCSRWRPCPTARGRSPSPTMTPVTSPRDWGSAASPARSSRRPGPAVWWR